MNQRGRDDGLPDVGRRLGLPLGGRPPFELPERRALNICMRRCMSAAAEPCELEPLRELDEGRPPVELAPVVAFLVVVRNDCPTIDDNACWTTAGLARLSVTTCIVCPDSVPA